MGSNNKIYMDTAASTKPSDAVINRMNEVVNEYANPSSIHDPGLKAQKIIYDSKKSIAEKLGCRTNELYFTSGATMGNQIAIQGWLRNNPNGIIMISKIEHNDIIELGKYLEKAKLACIVWLNVNHNGMLDLEYLKNALNIFRLKHILVVCQSANGECGTIQHIWEIAKIVHEHDNAVLMMDSTQFVPWNPYKICDISHHYHPDIMTLSGQKMHCIKGIGLLYIKEGIKIDPVIFGEQGLIGGTENVIGIACLAKAFEELYSPMNQKTFIEGYKELRYKQKYFYDGISKYAKLVGEEIGYDRLPNNIYIMFKCVSGEGMVELLNEHGIYVSSKSACSSRSMEPSHVLKAMGYSDKEASSCVRFTFDESVTIEQINKVIDVIKAISKFMSIAIK